MELGSILHYLSIASIVGLSSLGVGIGGGLTSLAALDAINIQPRAKNEINRALIIGLALIETAAILGLIMLFLLMTGTNEYSILAGIAKLGIVCAVGIPGFIVGLVSSFPVQKALYAIARQPFFGQKIMNIMLITQSIIQTAIIFGFIVALLINFQIPAISTITQAITLFAAGLCFGVGTIGPGIGLAQFAATACKCVSFNRSAYTKIVPFVFMSEAIIETPIIFAFMIALIIVGNAANISDTPLEAFRMIAAALAVSIGGFSPGLSSSKTARAASTQIAMHPENYSVLSQTSLFGQGLIDAAAIYALLISLMIIFMK